MLQLFSFGNLKQDGGTAIFNFCSSADCPTKKTTRSIGLSKLLSLNKDNNQAYVIAKNLINNQHARFAKECRFKSKVVGDKKPNYQNPFGLSPKLEPPIGIGCSNRVR